MCTGLAAVCTGLAAGTGSAANAPGSGSSPPPDKRPSHGGGVLCSLPLLLVVFEESCHKTVRTRRRRPLHSQGLSQKMNRLVLLTASAALAVVVAHSLEDAPWALASLCEVSNGCVASDPKWVSKFSTPLSADGGPEQFWLVSNTQAVFFHGRCCFLGRADALCSPPGISAEPAPFAARPPARLPARS